MGYQASKGGRPSRNSIYPVSGRASPSYIINNDAIVVVDVCFPSDAMAVLDFVTRILCRKATDIGLIVITHSHIDHVSGVDYLVKRTDAELAAHKNAQKYLMGKQSMPVAGCHQWLEFLGFLRKHHFPRPSMSDIFQMTWAGIPGIKKGIHSEVTHWLVDGDSLPGHPDWKVIHTPGHTDDSICLYDAERKSLVTGDTIINLLGQLVLNPLLALDQEALRNSLNKLRQIEVDAVYPGWGSPVFKKDALRDILETLH